MVTTFNKKTGVLSSSTPKVSSSKSSKKVSSPAYSGTGVPAYNAETGATTGKPSAEYDAYLKSLNKKGSANYIHTPDDKGFENMDAVNNVAITGQPVDTTQPNPATAKINPPNANPNMNPNAPGYVATPQPALGGAIATPQQATDLASQYKDAHAKAQSSGLPVPSNLGEAKSQGSQFLPPPKEDMSSVDALLAEDKGWMELQDMRKEYFDPENQKKSLMDTYNKLYKAEGLDQLDEEIIDAKTVIDGTEDDIRNEIQQAGGFGTDSQVQALALSRNKVLLKNYNNLVALKESKENHLSTMVSLADKDRSYASEQFDKAMNFNLQVLNYRDKFVNNTRDQLNKMLDRDPVGFYNAYSQDPRQMAFAEKILGVASGQLKSYADTVASQRAMDMEDRTLDTKIKKAQYNKLIAPPAPKILSVAEAKELGVPYGTTEDQAMGMKITPGLVDGLDEKTIGKIQSSPEYKTINTVLPAIQSLKAYKDAITKYGTTERINAEGKGTLTGTYGNALANWKSLAGLGALSGADFKLAENAIPSLGIFRRSSTSKAALSTSIDSAVTQAENLTRRLSQNYPQAASLLEAQLDDVKLTAYPERFTRGDDGKVYEIK